MEITQNTDILMSDQPSSNDCVLQWLMTDTNSPIHDFYPTDFKVDMEGKRNDWEGVVLIPFIDEARLLAASHTVGPAKLSRVRLASAEPFFQPCI